MKPLKWILWGLISSVTEAFMLVLNHLQGLIFDGFIKPFFCDKALNTRLLGGIQKSPV